MSGFLDASTIAPNPDFWYGLPYGYLQLDLQPSAEGIREAAREIETLPSEARERADQVFRLYAVIMTMMRKQQVLGCALGMHPDDTRDGHPSLSVLTISTVSTSGANPNATLLQMLGDRSAGTHPDNSIVPVELPIGTGYVIASERRTTAPTAPPSGREEPVQETVWQGTVAIPDTRTSSIITIQLVTPSLELSQDYRDVLLGVARTVTFTDPAAPGAPKEQSGPFSANSEPDERNPFG